MNAEKEETLGMKKKNEKEIYNCRNSWRKLRKNKPGEFRMIVFNEETFYSHAC
jgi:hypothetical protein